MLCILNIHNKNNLKFSILENICKYAQEKFTLFLIDDDFLKLVMNTQNPPRKYIKE